MSYFNPTTQPQKLPYYLLLMGIILAGIQFIYGRSLWLDEISLANNILHKDFFALLLPLDTNQVAPILFLWLEKAFSILIPNSDYSLRIFPFFLYLAVLFLFYKLMCRRFENTYIQSFCLALFIFNANLLNYSNEVKQYIGDVFVVVLFLYYHLGVFAIFISNIAILILATIGLDTVYKHILNRKNPNSAFPKAMLGVGAVWIATFALYFYSFVYEHPTTAAMREFWANEGAFLPNNPFSFAFFDFFRYQIESIFKDLMSFERIIGFFILLPLFALGLFSKKNTNKMLLTLPFAIHLFLSALKMYPVNGRLILYIIPLLILLIGEGVAFLIEKLKKNTLFIKEKPILVSIFPFFILILGGLSAFLHDFPIKRQEIKPCMAFIQQNIAPNDKIYVYTGATAAFRFYTDNKKFTFKNKTVSGNWHSGQIEKYTAEIASLQGDVWVLFSHVDGDDEILIYNTFKNQGFFPRKKRIAVGSSVYLYHFGQ
jgi:hypothetical protein